MEDVFGLGKHNKVLQDRRWIYCSRLSVYGFSYRLYGKYGRLNYYDGNIQLRGSRIKIQNTKDYGLSGKVDYMSNKFFMYLAILFHSTNKHKQGRYFWEYFWSIFYSHTYPQFKEIVHILSNYRGKYSEISFQTQDTLCLMHKLHFGGRFKKVSWFLF